ncbi:MAG: hypothetical protein KME60_30970 [Cyanomargarita calcarea GSE-NOS-MK-12-04C]|uniref:Tetratricopeptide repeat protein n=1 Tax=Cyanomargarita calcarea GSE-NOS-MK-12-04C TaxID=2839659 RepID=A0A951UW77_9CYAN|nr:hypothetical protein [Cyanomargarita calcarea GSE-NOS-MK-12-04C]
MKLKQYKAFDYRVVGFMVLLILVFPMGVAFSLSKESSRGVSGELTAQTQTQKQRREEAIRLNEQGSQLLGQGKYKEALELFI